MHKAKIEFPEKLLLPNVMSFARELDYYAAHDKITVDFRNATFFSPFGMLFLSSKIKHFRIRNPDVILDFSNISTHSYAAHMGFFRMFNCDHGRDVGEAWGGDAYLPITCVKRQSLYESEADRYQELPDLIQRHSDRLSHVLSQDSRTKHDMFDVLSYSIREVMRNVFEHSRSDEVYYCAQYWPKSNKVEIAIADFGVGVRKGLAENPNFRFTTDKEALEWCLLPSVSGKTHLPRISETWFNSGYGLYMTSRLSRHGGNFVICSGMTGIHLSKKTKTNYVTSFPGTALRMNLDISEIGNIQKRLQEFRKDGAALAKRLSGTGNRPPSAMSLLLRRDFSV